MRKNNLFKVLSVGIAFFMVSCSPDSDTPLPVGCSVNTSISTYDFSGSWTGQTTRLAQGNEMYNHLNGSTPTLAQLNDMFANGESFTDATLNGSGKNIRGKIAYGTFQGGGATAQAAAQADFDSWLVDYVDNVVPYLGITADNLGQAGTIGGICVNAKGMEIDQIFAKALIGALVYDNIANHYTTDRELDAETNDVLRSDNSTNREHYWDEAVGYIYGLDNVVAPDYADNDQFMNKYLGKSGFESTRVDLYNAFIKGRVAIAEDCKEERNRQRVIIKDALAHVIATKAHGYFAACANTDPMLGDVLPLHGEDYMHELAEGYGFLYSLQYTDYMTRSEVMDMLAQLDGSANGFWDVDKVKCAEMAATIQSAAGL